MGELVINIRLEKKNGKSFDIRLGNPPDVYLIRNKTLRKYDKAHSNNKKFWIADIC